MTTTRFEDTIAHGSAGASICFRCMEGETSKGEFLINDHSVIFLLREQVRDLAKGINKWLDEEEKP